MATHELGAWPVVKRGLRTSTAWFIRHFQLIAVILTVPGLAYAAWSQRDAIAAFDWHLSPAKTTIAIFLLALGPLTQAIGFVLALRFAGAMRAPFFFSLVAWTRSFLLRYSPGGALSFVYRIKVRRQLNADSPQLLTATGYEQFLAVACGAFVGSIGFLLAGQSPPFYILVILLASALLGFLIKPKMLGRMLESRLGQRKIFIARLLRGREQLAIAASNMVGWLAVSAGNYVIIDLLGLADRVSPLVFTGIFAVAFTIGVLLPLLPGGVGGREMVLVLLLSPALGPGPATALALTLRLLATVAELALVAAMELAWLSWGKSKQGVAEE